jgi:hypothetical protein
MKKIRMGLESCEDIHDTTLRGDDYDDEPRESNNQTSNNPDDEFDDMISTSRVHQPPSPTPAVATATQVSFFTNYY